MARKTSPQEVAARGFGDIIGVVLISLSLMLLVSLYSYDPHDLAANSTDANSRAHNWIGPVGARIGFVLFFTFGAASYLLPILLFLFGLSYLFQLMAYFHRRWLWSAILLVCCMGLLDLYQPSIRLLENISRNTNSVAGGWLGMAFNRYLFGYFGKVGATIIFATLYLISLLFLTNFQLGAWLRGLWQRSQESRADGVTPEEKALERRARELEKQAKKLKEQVEKSGLGADLQPVPEPTVRDLSVPEPKGFRSSTKPARARTPQPPEQPVEPEGEVISAKEIAAATTSQILGAASAADKTADSKPQATTPEPLDAPAAVAGIPAPAEAPAAAAAESVPAAITAGAPAKPRPSPKKPKPIAVAATPLIGNYQLPSMDLLHHPDPTVRPTESKEELMANARLMQQTLAQFDIEVALGDITKGPTITRYELHPAPGVKLEKITALNNNIAAALKAERIHILAPVPGKSSVGVEVPNQVKTKVIVRDLLESDEWRNSKARIPLALGKDVY
jgi:S-DNA-T family DNA segregation ATPase FtsK/SpoIIIE